MTVKNSVRVVFLTILFSHNLLHAQDTTSFKRGFPLIFDLTILDLPYQGYAAKTVNNSTIITAGGFLKGYANPGMQLSLDISTDFYTGMHHGISRLFYSGSDKSRRKKVWRNIAKNITIDLADVFSFYIPAGVGWTHEEYHRAVMTRRFVNSYNDINNIPLGSSTVSVSHETDEALSSMKKQSNPDFVRLQEAGIEGQYLLNERLQKNSFFYNQALSNEFLYWFNALNSILYVRMCSRPESVTDTEKMNKVEGSRISVRDFTGFDFCGWAYDLEHPDEPYEARGIHPSGVGINRYRTANDLSSQQVKYLRQVGNWQYINLLNPMMFGWKSFLLKKDKSGREWRGNFLMRHFLTSFGTDLTANFYYKTPDKKAFFIFHNFQNYDHWFPGIEAGLLSQNFKLGKFQIPIDGRVMVWIQPKNQEFKTSAGKPGGLINIKIYYPSGKILPFVELEAKTSGWVAGNVFLNSNITNKWGLRALL